MLAVVASLIVALTVTPALSAVFLSPEDAHVDPFWIRGLKAVQAGAIRIVSRFLHTAIFLVAIILVATLALLPFLGGTFLPEFREGHLVVEVTSKLPGTSLDEMMSLGKRISGEVLALPYVSTIEQKIGRAQGTQDTWGPHQCEFQIELNPDSNVDQAYAQAQIRTILARYPGIQSEVVTVLGDRISESLTGQASQVAIKLFGGDLDALDSAAQRVTNALSGEQGIVDLQFKRQSGTPVLGVELDPNALGAVGLKAQDALDTVGTDYAGTTVGQAYSGTRTVDVVIQLSEAWRKLPEHLNELTISGPFGLVPLSSVAKIVPSGGRYDIQHEAGLRFVAVTFNVVGRSLQSAVSEARSRVEAANAVPSGIDVDYSGAAAAEQNTRIELGLYSLAVLILIIFIMYVGFRWTAHPWLVMTNLPFSLIGGIIAIAVTGVGLSLGALVGLVTVFGISARNAILLLSYYEQLVDDEGHVWNEDTVLQGAGERLTPIFMTAVLTALGLAPLAFAIGQPGLEISGPMAITVLGGLASSTVLNLVLLPALAARYSHAGSRVEPH
jgi:Cu/Ag efflux pump CusA